MTKRVLVLDVGGTNLKLRLAGDAEATKIPSGPKFTPRDLVAAVKKFTAGKTVDVVTMGFPAAIVDGKIGAEPVNLGSGWVGFDFAKALGKPVKLVNDAAMQALGSYEGGTMLFLGLGTGLGSALVINNQMAPLELAHLPYRRGEYEDYVGLRGYEKFGKKIWREHVARVSSLLKAAMVADYVVLGGGQAKKIKELPPGCRRGDNDNAFKGGQRVWEPRKA
ncbi:MAG: ROK family protein [Vicinamibacteria bacterium]